ncbi:MAG TPA: nuclear transport factor 2 family protein, partial [bacterium]
MKCHILKVFSTAMVVSFALISCREGSEPFNIEAERQLVEKAIHGNIGWAKNKDLNLLYSTMANDTNLIIVNPDDRVVRGFQDFKKAEAFWMNPNFKAIRYDIRDLKINFSKKGDVAWFFCMLDDINEWKGQPANWE